MTTIDRDRGEAVAAKLFRDHPVLPRHGDHVVVLLVGSVAYGFADELSDLDVCVLCFEEAMGDLAAEFRSEGLRFGDARPNEVMVDGVQVHYFVQPFAKLEHGAEILDDGTLFMLKYARAVHDAGGRFAALAASKETLPPEVIEDKIETAQSLLHQRVHHVHEMHNRFQPLGWTEVMVWTAAAALELCCWLDHEPPSGRKWIMEQAQRCSSGPMIVPAVEGFLRALGPALDAGPGLTATRSPLAAAATALQDAATRAVKRAGYDYIPCWVPPGAEAK